MSNTNDIDRTARSAPRRRRTIATVAVVAAVLGSFAARPGDGTDTADTIEIAFGSTWS